jgi:hypothetical protein
MELEHVQKTTDVMYSEVETPEEIKKSEKKLRRLSKLQKEKGPRSIGARRYMHHVVNLRKKRASVMDALETKDAILRCELAKIVAEEALDVFSNDETGGKKKGASVGVALLAIARDFEVAVEVRKWLVGELERRFPDDELTKDTLARRRLGKETYLDVSEDGEDKVPKLQERIKNCLEREYSFRYGV